MGNFLKKVQKRKISNPLQKKFCSLEWIKNAENENCELEDNLITIIGLEFNSKLSILWGRFEALNFHSWNKITIRRSLVGMANRDAMIMTERLGERFENLEKPFLVEEWLSQKTHDGAGMKGFSPDDLIASGIDGMVLGLRQTFT